MKKTIFLALLGLVLTGVFVFKNGFIFKNSGTVQPILRLRNEDPGIRLELTDRQNFRILLRRAIFRLNDAKIDAQINIEKVELDHVIKEPNPNMERVAGLCRHIGVLYGRKLGLGIHCQLDVERKILTRRQLARLKNESVPMTARPVSLALYR